MPYLIVQRFYGDMLIDVRQVRLSDRKAQQTLAAVVACHGQVAPLDAVVWIALRDDLGVLLHGPICFQPDAALNALMQTGCPARTARDLLSERYAKRWIRRCYQHEDTSYTGDET